MLYDFRCDDCGAQRWVEMPMSEMSCSHVELCGCGTRMYQQRKVVAFTGDLPGRGNVGYYDPILGKHIVSGRQRRDLMEQRGLSDYSPSTEDVKVEKEAAYLRRHAKKSEARQAINNVAKASQQERRTKRVKEAVSNAVDEATRSVSA